MIGEPASPLTTNNMGNDMQYLREYPDGSRVKVHEYVYLADKQSKAYRQIHAFGSAIVYQMVN
jgi:hypothetical protein